MLLLRFMLRYAYATRDMRYARDYAAVYDAMLLRLRGDAIVDVICARYVIVIMRAVRAAMPR